MRLLAVLLLAANSAAVVIQVYTDSSCLLPDPTGRVLSVFADRCNLVGEEGFALDQCLASTGTIVLSKFAPPAVIAWGAVSTCAAPPTVSVQLSTTACTAVATPGAATKYMRVSDVRCDPPAPVFILRQVAPGAQASGCANLASTSAADFENLEFLTNTVPGMCTPPSVDQVPPATTLKASSVQTVDQGTGLDVQVFTASPACGPATSAAYSWLNVPVSPSSSAGAAPCAVAMTGVPFGLRIFVPTLYTTAREQRPAAAAAGPGDINDDVWAGLFWGVLGVTVFNLCLSSYQCWRLRTLAAAGLGGGGGGGAEAPRTKVMDWAAAGAAPNPLATANSSVNAS